MPDELITIRLRLTGGSEAAAEVRGVDRAIGGLDDSTTRVSTSTADADKTTSRFRSTLSSLGRTVAYASVPVIGALGYEVMRSVNAYREAAKVADQTNAVIKSTGGAARVSADDVAKLAETLSLKTGVDDEEIQSGANMLLCLEDTAEALTKDRGWQTHDQLEPGDEILSYDPETDETCWEPIRDFFRYEVDTELIRWRSKQIDVATTPHHRWWTTGSSGLSEYEPRFRVTEDISGKQVQVKIGGGQPGSFADEPTISDDLVELAAWVYTEGAFPKRPDQRGKAAARRAARGETLDRTCRRCGEREAPTKRGPAVCDTCRSPQAQQQLEHRLVARREPVETEPRYFQVGFSQSETANPENVARIRALLDRLRRDGHRIGESEYTAVYNDSTMVMWYFARDLGQKIRALLPDKKLTPGFLNLLTAEQAQLFLDVAILADGSVDHHGHRQFIQKDSEQLDVFAMLCSMLGIRTTRLGRGDALYLCATNHLWGNQVNAEVEPYSGVVWCPQIRTQIFMCRNRGKTFWTGNTFKNIRNEVGRGNDIFDQSVAVLNDMSSAMGKDMKSSAIQLGKALNDPIAGMSALSRVGVQFDEATQERITRLVEQGKTLRAQKIILRELTSEFGGSAKAQHDAVDKLGVAWENLEEKLGEALFPVLKDVTKWLTRALRQAQRGEGPLIDLKNAFSDVAGSVKWTVDRINDFLTPFRVAVDLMEKWRYLTRQLILDDEVNRGFEAASNLAISQGPGGRGPRPPRDGPAGPTPGAASPKVAGASSPRTGKLPSLVAPPRRRRGTNRRPITIPVTVMLRDGTKLGQAVAKATLADAARR